MISWEGVSIRVVFTNDDIGKDLWPTYSVRNSIPVFNDTPHFVIPYRFFDASGVSV
jgi:hypothetical protein